jgi:hypothetical protein
MESENQNIETQTVETQTVDIEKPLASAPIEESEIGTMVSPTKPINKDNTNEDWQEWVDVVVDFIAKMPEMIGKFYVDYQKPLNILALTITAGVTVYITLSVLDAISNIPLLSSILELVGLGYSIWFVMRYLLKASDRQQLSQEFESLKQQFLGNKSENN